MNDNYPFDKVGKKMPYKMPEDFFSQMQANVLAEVAKQEKRKAGQQTSVTSVSERPSSVTPVSESLSSNKPRKAIIKRICLAAASIAACVCLVVGIGYSVLSSDGESKTSAASPVNVASASEHSVDKAYDNLTSEEQQELNATYANDVYLCME